MSAFLLVLVCWTWRAHYSHEVMYFVYVESRKMLLIDVFYHQPKHTLKTKKQKKKNLPIHFPQEILHFFFSLNFILICSIEDSSECLSHILLSYFGWQWTKETISEVFAIGHMLPTSLFSSISFFLSKFYPEKCVFHFWSSKKKIYIYVYIYIDDYQSYSDWSTQWNRS